MTLDTQIRTQLDSAVVDTTVPPGLARAALAGGRRRRHRRAAAGLALVTAAVVAGGAVLLPDAGPTARDGQVAGGGPVTSMVALRWARSLPRGAAPTLPFFGEGGLWSAGERHDVPAEVNRAYPPRSVAGGWLVMLGQDPARLALAVMSADGTLRDLPASTFAEGYGDSRVEVSSDGLRVAYGTWVVDLTTMRAAEVPHQPESDEQDGFYTGIRMVGFTGDGLVYEGAPYTEGFGRNWLLREDGSTVQVDPPTIHIGDDVPADVAVDYDYAADGSDTCVTAYVLQGDAWSQEGHGCLGHALGEALTVSPDRQWLITDDLPEVWNLRDGSWGTVDMPSNVGRAQMDAQLGGVVWESADSFLLPVADRWAGITSPEPDFEQHAQVVRCTMSTGTCERAGDEQDITVSSTMWGTTELTFARS